MGSQQSKVWQLHATAVEAGRRSRDGEAQPSCMRVTAGQIRSSMEAEAGGWYSVAAGRLGWGRAWHRVVVAASWRTAESVGMDAAKSTRMAAAVSGTALFGWATVSRQSAVSGRRLEEEAGEHGHHTAADKCRRAVDVDEATAAGRTCSLVRAARDAARRSRSRSFHRNTCDRRVAPPTALGCASQRIGQRGLLLCLVSQTYRLRVQPRLAICWSAEVSDAVTPSCSPLFLQACRDSRPVPMPFCM